MSRDPWRYACPLCGSVLLSPRDYGWYCRQCEERTSGKWDKKREVMVHA